MIKNKHTFWDDHPCGNLNNDKIRNIEYRMKKEPFLKDLILGLKLQNNIKLLEIGCGQGLEAIYLASLLNKSQSKYYGMDLSNNSILQAKKLFEMQNIKNYQFDCLDAIEINNFYSRSYFDFVFSFGVLHHTDKTFYIINYIIYDILKKNSSALIFMYNKTSPKVFVALFLRKLSRFIDYIFNKENIIYLILKKYFNKYLNDTMVYECFGVPILKGYTKSELLKFIDKEKYLIEITSYDNKKFFHGFLPYMHKIKLKRIK